MADRQDTFDRADSATSLGTPSDGGAAWTAHSGTWGIISNQAYVAVGNGGYMAASLEASAADVDVRLTVGGAAEVNYWGVCARLTDDSNYLWVGRGGGNWNLRKRVAGTDTALGTYTVGVNNGDAVRLSLSGNSLSVYLTPSGGGELLVIGPVTESFNGTATRHGLWGFSTSTVARFDSFSVTGLAAGGPPYPRLERGTRGILRGLWQGWR
jgi:hypothetical protein